MLKLLGLAMVAVLALSAMAAGSASAHEWLLNKEPIPVALPVESHGELELTDMKGGLFGGEVKVICTGIDLGTVGPGAHDLIEAIHHIECVKGTGGESGSCGSPTAHAVNLPWLTELSLRNGELVDLILPDGNGDPGWLVACTVFGVTVSDTCTNPHGDVIPSNTPGSGVLLDFTKKLAEENPAECSRGGEGQGLVIGLDHILLEGLEVD